MRASTKLVILLIVFEIMIAIGFWIMASQTRAGNFGGTQPEEFLKALETYGPMALLILPLAFFPLFLTLRLTGK